MDMSVCYENLANAIVAQAVKEYRVFLSELRMNLSDRTAALEINSLERFFRSDEYKIFTSFDGETLIRKLREEAEYDGQRIS